jgi:hypothetical protein
MQVTRFNICLKLIIIQNVLNTWKIYRGDSWQGLGILFCSLNVQTGCVACLASCLMGSGGYFLRWEAYLWYVYLFVCLFVTPHSLVLFSFPWFNLCIHQYSGNTEFAKVLCYFYICNNTCIYFVLCIFYVNIYFPFSGFKINNIFTFWRLLVSC